MRNIIIPVDTDFNATLKIGTPAFPLQMFYDDLQNYANGFVNWHKQKQIEISLVLKGCVRLHELGKDFLIREGDGFVILPGFLHAVKPEAGYEAQYVTFIFDPVLLCGYRGSYFENRYYTPLRNNKNAVCILHKNSSLAQPVLDSVYALYRSFSAQTVQDQLTVQRKIQDLWILLSDQFINKTSSIKIQAQEMRICQMLLYLQQNYGGKFYLDTMAKEHNISRGECCRYFKRMMGMTLVEYLMEYRIAKAIELLETTNRTVTDISQAVGFGSTSRFIDSFKAKTSLTPLNYRKNQHLQSTDGNSRVAQQYPES